jgi:hypothetical protein
LEWAIEPKRWPELMMSAGIGDGDQGGADSKRGVKRPRGSGQVKPPA